MKTFQPEQLDDLFGAGCVNMAYLETLSAAGFDLDDMDRLGQRLRAMSKAASLLQSVDYVDNKAADEGLILSADWRAWRAEVRKVVRGVRADIPPEPSRLANKSEPQDPPAQAGFSLPHNFPENLSDKLSDWDTVQDEASLTTADLTQLMAGDETLAAAVERMTPGLDELLDMATVLSEPSFEQAIATIPPEKRNTWTERLFDERARLRLKRNTDEENLDRENLISRVATVFTKVGAKR